MQMERDAVTLPEMLERLDRDRYAIDNSDPVDVAYRRGWNAHAKHTISWLRGELVTVGLRELRDAPAVDMCGTVEFDLSETGGES